MNPKNLAIGVGVLALVALALKFTSGPADDSGSKSARQEVKGRLLLPEDKQSLLEKTHTIEITGQNSLYLNDDDKFRSDLANYVLAEDAKKDDEVVAKEGTKLDADTVAKLKEKDVSSVQVLETLVLEQGAAGWLVQSLFGLPADPDDDPFHPEDGFVKDIRKARIERTAGKAEKVAEKHETDKTVVTFKDESGATLWAFSPGKRHDSGGRFASVAGEEYAYHVLSDRDKDNDAWNWLNVDNQNSDWVEKYLLEHLEEDDEIEKVELTYPTLPPVVEAITFTREGDKWTTTHKVEGKDYDESKAKKLIDAITDARWNDLLAVDSENVTKAKGHFRKLLVHTKSLGTYQVQVGRSPAPPKEDKKEEEGDDKDDDKEEDEPEPGPVVTFIESKEVSSPLFKLAEKTALDAGEGLYNAIPDTIAGFFKDPPPPPPPPTPPAATSATGGTSPSGAATPTPPATPEPPKKPKISVATPPIPVPPAPPPTETPPAPPPTTPPPPPPPPAEEPK